MSGIRSINVYQGIASICESDQDLQVPFSIENSFQRLSWFLYGRKGRARLSNCSPEMAGPHKSWISSSIFNSTFTNMIHLDVSEMQLTKFLLSMTKEKFWLKNMAGMDFNMSKHNQSKKYQQSIIIFTEIDNSSGSVAIFLVICLWKFFNNDKA